MVDDYNSMEREEITAHLGKLVASLVFAQAGRLVQFLRYIVGEELAGRGAEVNQYALAMTLYDRDTSFDPAVDSVVRVDAGRLRTKLRDYYESVGKNDTVRFKLPKGSYGIQIKLLTDPNPENSGKENQQTQNDGPARSKRDIRLNFPIVVLPLDTLSDEKLDHELADGISAQIISNLSNSTSISVVSRRSAFAFKGKNTDARKIAEELGVNYILEGLIRRAGNRVRVSVSLIDAISGQQKWSETYQKELDDIFEFQDDIAKSIAAALGSALWVAATEGAINTPADQLNAAGLIHRLADQLLNYSRHNFDENDALVERALKLVPRTRSRIHNDRIFIITQGH